MPEDSSFLKNDYYYSPMVHGNDLPKCQSLPLKSIKTFYVNTAKFSLLKNEDGEREEGAASLLDNGNHMQLSTPLHASPSSHSVSLGVFSPR